MNQASIQESILTELATAVKFGNYTGSIGTPKSLVLVGHSFGSAITSAVIRASPTLADGLILTGWSFLRSDALFHAKIAPTGFNFNVNVSRGSAALETLQPRIASGEDPKWRILDNVLIFYKLDYILLLVLTID